MSKLEVIISFLCYGVLGWLIDSVVRTLYSGGVWTNGTGLHLPFSPMYAAGAVGILFVSLYIKRWALWEQFVIFAIGLSVYEYIGGAFSAWLWGHPLWQYGDSYTDPVHAITWGTLALLLIYQIHPRVHQLTRMLYLRI